MHYFYPFMNPKVVTRFQFIKKRFLILNTNILGIRKNVLFTIRRKRKGILTFFPVYTAFFVILAIKIIKIFLAITKKGNISNKSATNSGCMLPYF